MNHIDLLHQLERLFENDRFDDTAVLGFACDFFGVAGQNWDMSLRSQTGRERFRVLAQQMLRMGSCSEEDAGQQLEDLVNLMTLRDMFQTQDPGFQSALASYHTFDQQKSAQQITVLSNEKAVLAADNKHLQAQIDSLNAKLTDAEAQLHKSSQINADLTKLNEQLKEEISNLKHQNDTPSVKEDIPEPSQPSDPPAEFDWTDRNKTALSHVYWDKLETARGENWVLMPPQSKALVRQLCITSCGSVLLSLITDFLNLETVIITDPNLLRIAGAFKNCPNVSTLIIDSKDCDMTSVQADKLKGINILAKPGGTIASYAKEHGLRFMPLVDM